MDDSFRFIISRSVEPIDNRAISYIPQGMWWFNDPERGNQIKRISVLVS